MNKSVIIAFVIAAITVTVSEISFSTQVHAQATQFQGGTCTGPDRACLHGVTTPSGVTNTQFQSHNTGSTQQGGGATTFRTCGDQPTPSCTGIVLTPSGNENGNQHNTTSTP